RGILLAFECAREEPPVAATGRHGQVGFFRARLDLVENLLPQALEVGGGGVGVFVFGFEVGERVRIFGVDEPGVRVDDRVAVMRPLGFDAFCYWWSLHFARLPMASRGLRPAVPRCRRYRRS